MTSPSGVLGLCILPQKCLESPRIPVKPACAIQQAFRPVARRPKIALIFALFDEITVLTTGWADTWLAV